MLYSCQVSLLSDTKWQSYIGGGGGGGLFLSIIRVPDIVQDRVKL